MINVINNTIINNIIDLNFKNKNNIKIQDRVYEFRNI